MALRAGERDEERWLDMRCGMDCAWGCETVEDRLKDRSEAGVRSSSTAAVPEV